METRSRKWVLQSREKYYIDCSIAALCDDQLLYFQVLDSPGNAERFSHITVELARQRDIGILPGDSILIMDNVPFHIFRNDPLLHLKNTKSLL